jgi:hypothetical protein
MLSPRVERMTLMDNYDQAYEYVLAVREQVHLLSGWKATAIKNDLPRLVERLRVTLINPEANQVNAICDTQDKSQLCQNVYKMCLDRGGTTGNNRRSDGQVNNTTADRECVHYIKKHIFPNDYPADHATCASIFNTTIMLVMAQSI